MYPTDTEQILKAYEEAKRVYRGFGVDTDEALRQFREIPISLHCWQGDDVQGFEQLGDVASQNLVTGSYGGAARNARELRQDIDMAFSLSPCRHRVNLHSMYAEPKTPTPRNELTAEDFQNWIDWAKEQGYGLDFNASFFTHPMMVDGFSLASRRKDVRDYWIKAGIGARAISTEIGRQLGTVCVNNIWIPDGLKDIPANRLLYREYLKDSLDQIFALRQDRQYVVDVLEGKLFGIGVESFTVGSHEFYLAYAAKNHVGVCMDTGHYHPTESVVDKLSSVALLVDDLMLHISRGIRWDSDHVLIQCDDLTSLMQEMKRGGFFGKIAMGLDYFDASINRVAAWVVGTRNAQKALLWALLQPHEALKALQDSADFTEKMVRMEEAKTLPFGDIWREYCRREGVSADESWFEDVKAYEREVLSRRGT